ncbi:MAG TPA: GDSL-type esterase/lipase family protein [Opitutaceae bacterium]|nr:GDSL-type esterase/lipase family protein [Opitutaceae bacterium]
MPRKPLLAFASISLAFLMGCQTNGTSTAPKTASSSTSPVAASTAQAAPAAPKPAPAIPNPDPYWPPNGVFPGKGDVQHHASFRNTNHQRRTLFAERRKVDQNSLVFVGDSITQGWKTLEQDFATLGIKIANRGISGDTTPNLLYRLQDDVLSLHPRGLVILIGTNDLNADTTPTDVAENLRAAYAMIRQSYPDIPIALCYVMPRGAEKGFPEKVHHLNGLLDGIAHDDAHTTICDTYTIYVQEDGTSLPEVFHDRLHPNAAGYVKWQSALLPILSSWNLR